MKKRTSCFFLILMLFLVTHTESSATTNLSICGTGDSQELLRILANNYEALHPDIKISVPDSIGSGGGIRAVVKENCDLARIARLFTADEKNLGLTYDLFALSPVVFVLHPAMALPHDLTGDQIVSIFAAKVNNWEQVGGKALKIYLVSREPQDSSRIILEAKIPGFKEIETTQGKIFFSTQETVKAMVSYKQTIGYLPLTVAIVNKLNVLSFNGFSPSIKNVREGKYFLVAPFALAWKGKIPAKAKQFVKFLHSSAAQEIMAGQGVFAPLDN